MNIGILAWDWDEPETLSLERVARAMGHEPHLFMLDDVEVSGARGGLDVSVAGVALDDLDLVVSRVNLRNDRWQDDVEKLALIEDARTPVVDSLRPFLQAESKLIGLQRVARAGWPVPPTWLCRTVDDVRRVWSHAGPVVMKPSFNFGGSDVERAMDDFDAAVPAIERLLHKYPDVLVQPFLPHPGGSIRITVVGDELPLTITRIPPEGQWKANVALGAEIVDYDADTRAIEIARGAAAAVGVGIAGVDMVETAHDYAVLEVNNVPAWYSLPDETQNRIARTVIEYALGVAAAERSGAAT